MIWWLLIGIAAVSAAFFHPPYSPELWPALNSAGIAAAAYLLLFLPVTVRSPFRKRSRIPVLLISFIVIGSIAGNWILAERQGFRQRATLMAVKSVISRGVILSEVPDSLIAVLQKYYARENTSRATLGEVFRETYPYTAEKMEVFRSPYRDTAIVYTLNVLSDTQIVVVAENRFAHGRDSLFVNAGGGRGGIQELYGLTVRGVQHESEN